jgi:hypothetical protein
VRYPSFASQARFQNGLLAAWKLFWNALLAARTTMASQSAKWTRDNTVFEGATTYMFDRKEHLSEKEMELAVHQIAQNECHLDPSGINGLFLQKSGWSVVKNSKPPRERKVRCCAFRNESSYKWRIECNKILKMDEIGEDVLIDDKGRNPVVDYCYIRVPKSQEHSNHKTNVRSGIPLYHRQFLKSPSDTAEKVKQRLLDASLEFDTKQLQAFVKRRKRKFKKMEASQFL